tara:strand:- start:5965 stop:8316 length:2352 start_codon:yes stop_codon:yes gene_type:complete
MLAIPRWIWWAEFPNGDKKPLKVPCDIMGGKINHLDPANHMTYEQAAAGIVVGGILRLGFVIVEDDDIVFLDLDHCILPDGTYTAVVQELLQYVPGALLERSVSGTGLHALWSWSGETPPHRKKNPDIDCELYTEGRFLALGEMAGAVGNVGTQIDPTPLINAWFAPKDETLVEWRDTPVPEWNGQIDDNVLIANACKPGANDSSVFGGGEFASFKDLWTGDTLALSRHFPGDGDYGIDWSRVDHALAKQLAYHTGKDHTRIERLMRGSGLYREKWDNHKEYLGKFTIVDAVNKTKAVYGEKKSLELPEPGVINSELPTVDPRITSGAQMILGPDALMAHFNGCVYIAESDRVLMPNGIQMKQPSFKVHRGGYTFGMNEDNSKVTTNAWEAFTQNQVVNFPQAHAAAFRPDLPFGALVDDDGTISVNTYKAPTIPRTQGDISRLIWLMQTLWPKDWEDLFYFMCFLAQYPGVKAKWLPLMQGPPGCGKGIMLKIASRAVGGPSRRYVFTLDPNDIANNFNAFIACNLLVTIDEIKVGSKWEMIEKMKTYVTEDYVQVTSKGVDSTAKRQCANYMACTNHRTGVPIQADDRRWGMFWSEPQDYGDMLALGLTTEYYSELHKWLEKEGGYDAISHALATTPIPDAKNPAVGSLRAPITSSRVDAIEENMGKVEQLIVEAFDTSRAGFMDNLTSSSAIREMLKSHNIDLPSSKFVEIMRSLGWVRCPGLKGNRYKVNNTFIGEEGTPVIYALKGHSILLNTKPGDIRSIYMHAQGYDKLIGVPNNV